MCPDEYQLRYDFLLVPTAYPLETQGQETSSSSLLIKWDAIPREYHQGNLLGYSVKYQYVEVEGFYFRGGSLNGTVQTQGIDIAEAEIQGLHLYTNYTIQVAGYTIAGEGLWSPPIVVSTGIFCKLIIHSLAFHHSCISIFSLNLLRRRSICCEFIPPLSFSDHIPPMLLIVTL